MKSNLFLFLVVVLVGFFPGITSDIYIPSVPAIADDLKTSIDKAQGTLSIFMFGLSISQLVYGPISEGIGRRYPLIICMRLGSSCPAVFLWDIRSAPL
jgi:DHA1 family bicyclomycin/chloramphenicol resistance-like MFS transporter/DHA1 family 2-module integral membrane pump EmrD-like MFS transporter